MDTLNKTSSFPLTIVYWLPVAGADKYGQDRVAAPEEGRARRESSSSLRVSDFLKDKPVTEALCTPIELPAGTIVWEGKKKNLTDTPTPLFQVVATDKVPDVKGVECDYSAVLAAFTDKLPKIV